MFYVNVYELRRCYGGPEEGGWWYDEGSLVDSVTTFTEGWAEYVAAHLRDGTYPLRSGAYADSHNRGNVNYDRGSRYPRDYEVRVEKTPGEDWNNYRPYE